MSNLKLQVWERQPTETNKAWSAFLLFRDAVPAERGLKEVAERLKISVQAVGKWSAKYNWFERVAQYDSFIDRSINQQKRIELERAKNAMVERHTRTSVHIQNRIVSRMTEADFDKLSPVALSQLYLKVATFERQSRGLPGNSIEIRTPEQIRAQQITEAKLYFDEIRSDHPILTEVECLAIVCEAFEVTPKEIGFSESIDDVDFFDAGLLQNE
jgi:hypothetical protein